MHRIFALFPLTIVAAACVRAEATPVVGPDGQPGWFAVSCKRNQANCYEMAGEVCPGGYEIAGADSRTGVAVAGAVTTGSSFVAVHPTYHGELLIKCRGAVVEVVQTTAAPEFATAAPAPGMVVQAPAAAVPQAVVVQAPPPPAAPPVVVQAPARQPRVVVQAPTAVVAVP